MRRKICTALVYSSSESETEEDSEEPKRKQPTRTAKKAQSKKRKQVVEDSSAKQTQFYDGKDTLSELETEVLQEFLRKSRKKKTNEKAAAQGKKGAPLPSTKGHYDSSETIPEVNLGSENDPLSQGQTDQSSINKPADSMLSLVEESANDPAEQNMMVVRVETQSQTEALSIVLIQVYVLLSQTTPVPAIEPSFAKSLREKISEERTESTPQPLKPDESTPTVPPALSKINPASEDAVALMMAWTASYIPKEGPMPSFSLGLTDSSQKEEATQEGQRAKSPETPKLIKQLEELVEKIANSGVKTEGKRPQIEKQSGKEIFEKFETPMKSNEMSTKMKEKCYVWATRVKTNGDGSTNEYDPMCTLKAQDRYILSKFHFASLKAATHIEAENMAIGNHPNGEFLQPKTKKPFRVKDYPMFIPFLDLKKLASHSYVYVCAPFVTPYHTELYA
ncbi:uncharacterized protein DS421_15g515670 [Arachis hypogaea]|nr:uncharacterized protein DS421_15g515670 [Arachis hypogaea]